MATKRSGRWERSNAHHVPRKGNADGGEARFAFDRMAIERFRRAFPRARWSDERNSWFAPERRPRGGSTAGWRKRQSCSLSTATVMVVMLSPSIRFRAHICRFPMTCVFARLIRRPSLRNCGQFRGQVGTTSCEPGGCRSVRLRSFGADGRASKRLPDMRTRSLSLSAAKWLSHDAASRPLRRRNRTIRGAILKRSYDDESQAIVAPRRRRLQLRPREPHLEV